MRVIVSDTSPLRCLSHLRRLDLIAALLEEVIVPPAVVRELIGPDPSAPRLDVTSVPGIRVVAPADTTRVVELGRTKRLDRGEAEAIVLALELSADLILIDERKGEAVARHAGLPTFGVLGLLAEAQRAGLVADVGALMDELSGGLNFYIGAALRDKVLRLANER